MRGSPGTAAPCSRSPFISDIRTGSIFPLCRQHGETGPEGLVSRTFCPPGCSEVPASPEFSQSIGQSSVHVDRNRMRFRRVGFPDFVSGNKRPRSLRIWKRRDVSGSCHAAVARNRPGDQLGMSLRSCLSVVWWESLLPRKG